MLTTILRQKLAIPSAWPSAIRRDRVLARLDQAVDAGQHLVILAGSGYGKSMLLAEWCRQRPSAWLSLDAEDADLDSFLAYLVAAFESAIEGFRTEARGMLGRARDREGAMAALSALLADLDEQCEQSLILVLDDYHLAASPTLDALVVRMLKYLPPAVRLAVVSRHTPEFEWAGLRAKRMLVVLGEQDLAFDCQELGLLHPALSAGDIEALREATGGWPAAVGMTPSMLEAYLNEQVLSGQPPLVRSLLLRLSLVDTFDTLFCEDVLEELHGTEWLEGLVRQRLILPTETGRYAVPEPLRGMLRQRFSTEVDRKERTATNRRIGEHFWRSGQALTAMRWAIENGEGAWTADRLEEIAEAWLAEGRLEALASVLGALGSVADRPELCLAEGEAYRRWGDFERAQERFERALEGFESRADAEGRARVLLRQALSAASRGLVERARELLAEALPGLRGGDRLDLDRVNLEGGLEQLAGNTAQAIARFEEALKLSRRLADPYAEARATHNLAVCYTRLGSFRRALECYDAALGVAGEPLIWMTPINRALVLVYLGRVEEALDAAQGALDLVRRYGLSREEGYALRILGYAHARAGNLDAAESCYEAAELNARRSSDALGLAYSLNFLAELSCQRADLPRATALSAKVEATLGGAEAMLRMPEFAHVRAKILLASGRLEEAGELVQALLERAKDKGYKHLLFEAEKLAAELARLQHRDQEAERLEKESADLAQTEGYSDRPAITLKPTAPELSIRCFGGLRVARGGVEIGEREWQSARAKLLLAFLLHTPEGATKTRLFEAIYPDEVTTDASMNMNLMRLRKALEPGLEKGQPSRFVLRADSRYSFNRQTYIEVDTLAFDRMLRAAHGVSPDEEVLFLKAALLSYTGDFLPEFENEWVLALRQRYRDKALGGCRRLLELIEDSAASLEIVHRALEIDPLSEEFNRELILRFLEAEEPHRAIEHYRLCERRYKELLGIEPPSDLSALVDAL